MIIAFRSRGAWVTTSVISMYAYIQSIVTDLYFSPTMGNSLSDSDAPHICKPNLLTNYDGKYIGNPKFDVTVHNQIMNTIKL